MFNLKSWMVVVPVVVAMGCHSAAEIDPAAPASLQFKSAEIEDPPAPPNIKGGNAWAPDKEPIEEVKKQVTHGHIMEVNWSPISSLEELKNQAGLIVRGHVVKRRYDALRSVAQAKDGESVLLGPDGKPPTSDAAVTIATFRIDKVVRSMSGMVTPSRTAAVVGSTVEVIFAGGLLDDGCVVEPDDNPLPVINEEAVLFLQPLVGTPAVGLKNNDGVYGIVGGVHGRLKVAQGKLVPTGGKIAPEDTVGLSKLHGTSADAFVLSL